MTHPLVDEARALTAAVTPGPWVWNMSYVSRYGAHGNVATTAMSPEGISDAALIARSRTLLVEMADELDRLTGEIEWMRGELLHGSWDSGTSTEHRRRIAAGRPAEVKS